MSIFRRNLSYSNVVSTLCLFVVLGGTAAAVDGSLPGQDTVGSEDIIGNEVKSGDIADGRIFSVDIADDRVKSADIRDETIVEADLAPPADWTPIALNVQYIPTPTIDGSIAAPSCYRDLLGVIHLRGFAKRTAGGGDGSVLGTLPQACWPVVHSEFIVARVLGSTGVGSGSSAIFIDRNSGLIIIDTNQPAQGDEISLDGVTYRGPAAGMAGREGARGESSGRGRE